jgi:hypothetical protein
MTNELRRTPRPGSWEDSIAAALLGTHEKQAPLRMLYAPVRQLRERRGLPLNPTFQATIRRTLQQSDLFCQDEHGSGVWRLASKRAAAKKT